jgi:DNA polymerase-1
MKMAGIILPTITKKGVDKETTQIEYLEKIKDTHPAIPTIIKHNILEHAHTSFGQTWADFVNPLTERIHPDIFQIGTETYRFSFKNPNFQQIPTENLYRNCFIPNPGNKLIGGDYNGMELRIIAEASQDSQMIMAFNKGLDLHTYTASIIFSIPYEKMIEVLSNKSVKDYIQYKLYRTRAKNLNFGIVYGIGAKRFAANAGITEKEAYKIIDDYFALYKGLKMWLDWAKQQARYDWESRSLAGRLYRHTHKKDDEFWKISAAERLGCNFPIQATNADITKIALRNLYDEFGRKIKIVNCIHDEILIECAEKNAKKFQPIFDRCMIAAGEVYIKSVPVLVESEIMDRWSK